MMSTKLRAAALAAALALLVPLAASAAGGSSTPATPRDPQREAADAYNRALEYRDKAWGYEEEAAAASDPAAAEKYEKKAAKEYGKAIRSLRTATDLNPRMHQAWSSLGYALRKTGEHEQALEAYDRALEISPGYTEAIEYRGEAYLGLGRVEEAKGAYMELFRQDREKADQLMKAMESWAYERMRDPAGLDEEVMEDLLSWLRNRSEMATRSPGPPPDSGRDW